MRDLKKYQDQMAKCSFCEFCQATCPVYLEDLLETHVARARMNLVRACLVENSIPVSERFEEVVNRCLLCTNCVQACPAKIPVDEIVISARHKLYGGKRRGPLRRGGMKIFMQGRGFGLASLPLSAAQTLASHLGIAPEELPRIAGRSFAGKHKGVIPAQGKQRGRVAYFVGCATNSFYPGTAEDVVKVLTENGIEVLIPEGLSCCGLPALVEGDLDTAQELAVKNFSILTGLDVDAVVTDCTSCGMALKVKVAKAIPEDNPLFLKAVKFAPKVWEVTDYLNKIGLVNVPAAFPQKITYHIPCHRGWSPTLPNAPRNLLAKIPGLQIAEMEFPEKCCGAGGTFFMEYGKLSKNIRSKKIEDILQTSANILITQCPSCRSYLAPALPGLKIMHPASLLARAYGF
jgi:glycolate oxidase iron-sulfur subunit